MVVHPINRLPELRGLQDTATPFPSVNPTKPLGDDPDVAQASAQGVA